MVSPTMMSLASPTVSVPAAMLERAVRRLAVAGRLIFGMIPNFKPVAAIVTVTGVYMGASAGFLAGSLAALLSNLFFGQGPWTPFQMAAWGLIGFFAGLPFLKEFLKKAPGYVLYGLFAAVFYSGVMNLWAALSIDSSFSWKAYGAAAVASLPTLAVYGVSNIVFLWLLSAPVGKKLDRIAKKHGIF